MAAIKQKMPARENAQEFVVQKFN